MPYRLVSGEPVGQWVAKQTGGIYCAAHAQAIGFERDGKLVAGIIFEDWNGKSIVCHLSIRGHAHPKFFREIAIYAFGTCKVHKIIAPIGSDKTRMIAMAKKMGFKEEGRIVNAQPLGDIVIFTMTGPDCRFLGERYGKATSPKTA